MKIAPTPLTAALAGGFAGLVMPWLWPRLGEDTLHWIAAFLLVMALPAHAFVLGFARTADDSGLPRRVLAWLASALAVAALRQLLPA